MPKKKKLKVNNIKLDTGFESKEQAAQLGYIATRIERISDGRVLTLNSDLQTYSFNDLATDQLSANKFTYERLMNDYRCIGQFKVISWVKDFNAEKFLKFLNKESQ